MPSWYHEDQSKGLRLSFEIKKRLVSKKTKYQVIDIFDSVGHGKVMALDKKIMVTEKDEFVYHEMISNIPFFSHKRPKRVLVIGGGDGGTVRELVKHKDLEQIDLCEIDGEVISLSKKHLKFTSNKLGEKRVTVYVEDGFKFLQDPKRKKYYDLILVDSTDPIGMAAKLFEKSFFDLVKDCLHKDGIVAGQCESPFYFEDTIRETNQVLNRTFKHVKFFTAPIITYPSGYWSFFIASDKRIRLCKKKIDLDNLKLMYFNFDIYHSAFGLPNFYQNILKGRPSDLPF